MYITASRPEEQQGHHELVSVCAPESSFSNSFGGSSIMDNSFEEAENEGNEPSNVGEAASIASRDCTTKLSKMVN